MKSNDDILYYLIFDTNTLFQAYDKKADFTSFCFNSTYSNVVDMINQLDIYSRVTLAIPTVVWGEMEKQIVEKHDELIILFETTLKKRIFPEYSILENQIKDYSEYIREKIDSYKSELSGGINTVLELPIATSGRFESIVKRAFEKQPPFEGKDKKSDKGFKDALLWESILEFASTHSNSKIIYYSKDNVFGDVLLSEFSACEKNSTLYICKNEGEIKNQLEIWAKEIDEYSYQPINDYEESKNVNEWLNSADFLVQIVDNNFEVIEKGRLITDTVVHLISVDNIELQSEQEDKVLYSVDVVLHIEYKLKDGRNTSEMINATIIVESLDETVFTIEDIYRTEAIEDESED